MKSIIYYSCVLVLFIIVFVGYSFQLKPLKFKLNSIQEFIGWILVFVGIVLITLSQSKDRYMKGYQDALNDISKQFNESKP